MHALVILNKMHLLLITSAWTKAHPWHKKRRCVPMLKPVYFRILTSLAESSFIACLCSKWIWGLSCWIRKRSNLKLWGWPEGWGVPKKSFWWRVLGSSSIKWMWTEKFVLDWLARRASMLQECMTEVGPKSVGLGVMTEWRLGRSLQPSPSRWSVKADNTCKYY